jgi:broad specificity phosphatase PhoE
MRVCFLRHAQGTHNEAALKFGSHIYTSWGYKDALLTELGKEQAAAVVLPFTPDRIYCSPLRRCIQTIRATLTSSTLIIWDGLLERQGEQPCNVRDTKTNLLLFDPNLDVSRLPEICEFPFGSRESDKALQLRIQTTLEEIYRDAASVGAEKILIVGHCEAFHSVLSIRLQNAEIHVLEVTGTASQG